MLVVALPRIQAVVPALSRCEPRLGTEEIELIPPCRAPVDDDDWRDAIPEETPLFFFHVEGGRACALALDVGDPQDVPVGLAFCGCGVSCRASIATNSAILRSRVAGRFTAPRR